MELPQINAEMVVIRGFKYIREFCIPYDFKMFV